MKEKKKYQCSERERQHPFTLKKEHSQRGVEDKRAIQDINQQGDQEIHSICVHKGEGGTERRFCCIHVDTFHLRLYVCVRVCMCVCVFVHVCVHVF